jgi:hypothetical protein
VKCKSWLNFVGLAESHTDCYIYAYVLLNEDYYGQMGKTLSPNIGRELESKKDSKSANENSDKVRNDRKGGKNESNTTGKSDIESVLSMIAADERRHKALEFLASAANDDKTSKDAALKKMIEIAGLN